MHDLPILFSIYMTTNGWGIIKLSRDGRVEMVSFPTITELLLELRSLMARAAKDYAYVDKYQVVSQPPEDSESFMRELDRVLNSTILNAEDEMAAIEIDEDKKKKRKKKKKK